MISSIVTLIIGNDISIQYLFIYTYYLSKDYVVQILGVELFLLRTYFNWPMLHFN